MMAGMVGTDRRWSQRTMGSGSQLVQCDDHRMPWLYVTAAIRDDVLDYRQRHAMCGELAAFLNGGARPGWLDDLERFGHEKLIGTDGTEIEATGPLYDADPPSLNWRRREDAEARRLRTELIDLLRPR